MDRGITLKIKPVFVAFSLVSVLFVSACSASNENGKPNESLTPSPSQSTDSADSVVIPTPSATPVAYEGELMSFTDLLSELNAVYPTANWTASYLAEDQENRSEVSLRSNDKCFLSGYSTFQLAVDNDFGARGNFSTTTGSFGQLGVILMGRDECVENTSSVVRYPSHKEAGSDSNVLTASLKNINDCLVRQSACFLDEGVRLPERDVSSFSKILTEVDELANNGFCADTYFSAGGLGGYNNCEASTEKTGISPGDYITQVAMDLAVLRISAKTPSNSDSIGKYVIFGDGWALYISGSTEAYKQVFVDMNKLIKGQLVARF